MGQAIGVLVVEDRRLVRDRLVTLVDEQPDLNVVAAAEGPAFAGALFSHIAKRKVDRSDPAAIDAARISKREREVIALIAEGLSNKEIAGRLNLATHTVKSHVHNILEKLALHNRLQIAAHAHGRRVQG